MSAVTIVQLFPDELGVAGDRGNVLALKARLTARGCEVAIIEVHSGDRMPDTADIVVVGNGPLSAMRNVYDELQSFAPVMREWHDSGVPIFAYGSGAELLSHGIEVPDGGDIAGLGLFPFRAKRVQRRTVGYVIVESVAGQLVGFEDNASDWILDEDAVPLGTVSVGDGNGDGREGVLSNASVATQIGGPVLPLNPGLADVLVERIAHRQGRAFPPAAITALDEYAENARAVIVGNAAHVFSRI